MAVKKKGKTWWYDFYYNKVRYRKAVRGAPTKWHAEQIEAKAKRDVFEGRHDLLKVGSQLFEQFVDEHYSPWSKANKKTWRNDELILGVLKQNFRGKTLREVSPLAVEKFKRERAQSITKRGTTRSPASVNMELAVLSRVFELAIELEAAGTNPCRKVRKLRADNQRNRYLSADEETALIAQLRGHRKHLRPLVEVALGTGMRRGELLALTWPAVDFARGVIKVQQTKTGKDREVPMSARVREVLLEVRRARKADRVFTSNRKKSKSLGDVKKSFSAACSDAGVADFHFHDLRHTFATRLADAGVHAVVIKELLGHASMQTTARYTHATNSALRSAVESVVQIVDNTTKMPLKRVAASD